MPFRERLIHYSLGRLLKKTAKKPPIECEKVVIFSDHHKGIRNGADDFEQCESSYNDALDYFYKEGYTLIILGDAEELWEESVSSVIKSNEKILKKEALFFNQNRYYRIYGNHDYDWKSHKLVKQYLWDYFPKLKVHESLLITVSDRNYFLFHGHQGELLNDYLRGLSKVIVKWVWRTFQLITKKSISHLSKHIDEVKWHDDVLYKWSSKQKDIISIAGHTHRPIWLSHTHKEQKEGKVTKKECYFNTGCCCCSDGDITGITITSQRMQLIKYAKNSDTIEEERVPIVLAEKAFNSDHPLDSTKKKPISMTVN